MFASLGGIAGVTGLSVMVGGVALYKVARPFFSVTVNCWFCNRNCKVRYEEQNTWTCPECGQYNGFTADGDYNREIIKPLRGAPVRYAVRLKGRGQEAETTKGNDLCHNCNLNQDLKIHQLSKFVASEPEKYDEEISEYAAHLERVYRLCRRCEAILHQKLGEQDSRLRPQLLTWKLESNRQSSLKSAAKLAKSRFGGKWLGFFRIIVSMLSIGIAVSAHYQASLDLPDQLPLVVGILAILSISYLRSWPSFLTTLKHQLCLGSWLIYLTLLLLRHYRVSSLNIISDVDKESSLQISLPLLCSLSTLFSWNSKNVTAKRKANKSQPQINTARKRHSTPSLSETTLTQDLLSSTVPSEAPFVRPRDVENHQQQLRQEHFLFPDHEVHQTNDKYDISSLSLDGDDDEEEELSLLADRHSKSFSPFSVKRYDYLNQSGINFGEESFGHRRRRHQGPLIRPSNFCTPPRNKMGPTKKVAQSSWVAGGYWHPKEVELLSSPETISRSSSQSSGFISCSTQQQQQQQQQLFQQQPQQQQQQLNASFGSLPNSRVPSVVGEIQERVSVLSELPYKLSRPRQQQNDNSFDSNFGDGPKAESSPLKEKSTSFLEKQIHIRFSFYSLIFTVSVGCNLALTLFLGLKYYF